MSVAAHGFRPDRCTVNRAHPVVDEPTSDKVYAVAELAYIDARRKQDAGLTKEALEVFTKRLRDQLGHDYEIDVRTRQPLD